jgi:hypothetical protein
MESNMHLFTELKDGLPTEKGYYLAIFCNYYNGSEKIMPFIYEKGYDFDNGTWRISHWLDLSKLTTKERAEEAMEGAYMVAVSDTVNSGPQPKRALKILKELL